ncbi:hypothetical protein FIBSPDRAFT_744914 [Athelia psychrophila]|uniref:Uncharacterized protein n=1 Tax=Athelia psychrophila TaxID=1759441 RepID=A0A166HER4_9AGAM|nr:hypothetical protein FIBSPDRAFT_744914 [Fibularhizoctonia sp. CBS 109695]
MSTPLECARVACSNAGTSRCTGCKGAEPETLYCSVECQTRDWKMFHKTFCGKKAYTFELTLIGSSDPVISRTFDVPSWFTFRQMHYTLQYTMGPWMQTHLHDFYFEKMTPAEEKNRNLLSPRKPLLKISSKGDLEVDTFPKQDETKIKLSDVYEPTGRLRDVVAPGGELATLIYLYDFGVCLHLL